MAALNGISYKIQLAPFGRDVAQQVAWRKSQFAKTGDVSGVIYHKGQIWGNPVGRFSSSLNDESFKVFLNVESKPVSYDQTAAGKTYSFHKEQLVEEEQLDEDFLDEIFHEMMELLKN